MRRGNVELKGVRDVAVLEPGGVNRSVAQGWKLVPSMLKVKLSLPAGFEAGLKLVIVGVTGGSACPHKLFTRISSNKNVYLAKVRFIV